MKKLELIKGMILDLLSDISEIVIGIVLFAVFIILLLAIVEGLPKVLSIIF